MCQPIDRDIVGAGRWLTLVRVGGWEFVERASSTGVVAVLAFTAEGSLLLTEQFRPAVNCRVIDLPAGLAGDGSGQESEALSEAAERELEEEVGYRVGSLEHLATLPTSPGLTSETVDLFAARDLIYSGPGGGDESEQITVHHVALDRLTVWLEERVEDGCLVDPKVYAALWLADQRHLDATAGPDIPS